MTDEYRPELILFDKGAEWLSDYKTTPALTQTPIQALHGALKQLEHKKAEQERKENKMKDVEAELSRLEDLISAQHPCDARMYGLELCELVRTALEDAKVDEKVDAAIAAIERLWGSAKKTFPAGHQFVKGAPDPGDTVMRLRCDQDDSYWWRLSDNTWWGTWGPSSRALPATGGRDWKTLFSGGRNSFTHVPIDDQEPAPAGNRTFGKDDPMPTDVDHVIDNDGDHWWRRPGVGSDRWATTNNTDHPPNWKDVDYDDTYSWTNLMRRYPPFKEAKPQSAYPARVVYNKDNPPPPDVRAVQPADDDDVTYYRPRNRDAWRSTEWDDDDIKTEGYSTWQELCRDFGGSTGEFVKVYDQKIPEEIARALTWRVEDEEEDEEPHESIIAVMNMGTGNHYWRCTCGKGGWINHDYYTPRSPTVCSAQNHYTWEQVMENHGEKGVQELLAAKDK